MIRHFWGIAGGVSVAVGAIGAVLPLVPGTPFLLLGAYCFARSSPALHDWLLKHEHLGPPIHAWQMHRAVTRSTKWTATAMLALAPVMAAALGAPAWALALQAVLLAAVGGMLWTRPEPPEFDLAEAD